MLKMQKSIGHLLRQGQGSLSEVGGRSGLFRKKNQTSWDFSVVYHSVFTLVKLALPEALQALWQYSFVNGFKIKTKLYHEFWLQ